MFPYEALGSFVFFIAVSELAPLNSPWHFQLSVARQSLTFNLHVRVNSGGLLTLDRWAKQGPHVCARKNCPPWGWTLQCQEAIGYFRHHCCQTRLSVRRCDQTMVVSCWSVGGFVFWPLGLIIAITVFLIFAAGLQNALTRLGPVRTNIQSGMKNIKRGD